MNKYDERRNTAMSKYEALNMEVIVFANEDVITTSGDTQTEVIE